MAIRRLHTSEFERALIRERQREGIVLAQQRGAYRGRKPSLSLAQQTVVRRRIAADEAKASIARELGSSRQTLYHYVHLTHKSEVID